MNPALASVSTHELRFRSLFDTGRAMSFPCDLEGHVDLDILSERGRHNYLFARTLVGREYATPEVCSVAADCTQCCEPRSGS